MRRELEVGDQERSPSPPWTGITVFPNVFFGFLGNVGRAIAGLLENLVTFLILAILGVLAVHFQRERLEVVATTARTGLPCDPASWGWQADSSSLPVWIVGIIALAITIIGIPVLLAWVPLFPIAGGCGHPPGVPGRGQERR